MEELSSMAGAVLGASWEPGGPSGRSPLTGLDQSETSEPADMAGCDDGATSGGIGRRLVSTASECESKDATTGKKEICDGCGVNRLRAPRLWGCEVCPRFVCEDCHRAPSSRESPAAPPHTVDHVMKPVSFIAICDGCWSSPILNRRWTCEVCPNFDLCETCYKEPASWGHHLPQSHSKEHCMRAIEVIFEEWTEPDQRVPNFPKPADPQWSYHIYYAGGSGFEWKRKFVTNVFDSGVNPEVEQRDVHNPNIASNEVQNDGNKAKRRLDPKCKIFLSHAGHQKQFVEHLNGKLRKVHHFGVFFDKEDDSLPKGERFPPLIIAAAKQCEVAIIVVSDEYFRRKWPVLELVTFVKAKRERAHLTILPVFYGLTVGEFKQPKRQREYLKCWKQHEPNLSEDDVKLWREAMKTISSTNGIDFDTEKSEVALMDEVVEIVCKRIVPGLHFDVSDVQGKDRLSKIIEENLEGPSLAAEEIHPGEVTFVGLYGMGGMGKTTLSKVVCNNMQQQFVGKVCYVELGSADVLKLRKQMLLETTSLDETFVTNKVKDIRVALKLLKEHFSKQKVFVVLDNVTEENEYIQEARTLLTSLPFGEGSVVLVTARSLEILERLNIKWHTCMLTPTLNKDEALRLFLEYTNCEPSQLLDEEKKTVDIILEHCCFDVGKMRAGEYHPLALKVLGGYFGCNPEEWQDKEKNLDLKHSINEEKHPIFKILRTSYDTLSTKKKKLFLHMAAMKERELWAANVFTSFQFLDNDIDFFFHEEFNKELKKKSLIEALEWNGRIYIHDLYREFAQLENEAVNLRHSKACILQGRNQHGHYQERSLCIYDVPCLSSSKTFEHLEAKKMLCKCSESEIITLQKCSNLKVADFLFMETLRVVTIKECPQLVNIHVFSDRRLFSITCKDYRGEYPFLYDLPELCVLSLEFNLEAVNDVSSKPLHLSGCPNLIKLGLMNHPCIRELPDFRHVPQLQCLYINRCEHLEKFIWLETLSCLMMIDLRECSSLLEFPPLTNFQKLVVFYLSGAVLLKEVSSFSNLRALKDFRLRDGKELKDLPGICACTGLDSLDLQNTAIEDFSWICSMNELTSMDLSGTKFTGLSSWKELRKLEELGLNGCLNLQSLENMDNLPALRLIEASGSENLKTMPLLSKFPALRHLVLNSTAVEDVSGVERCVQLESLRVSGTRITSLPNLSNLLKLKVLNASGCSSLKRLDNIKCLPSLEELFVHDCINLVALPDLHHCGNFKGSLSLRNTPLVDPNLVKLPTYGKNDASSEDSDSHEEDIFDGDVAEEKGNRVVYKPMWLLLVTFGVVGTMLTRRKRRESYD